MIYRGKPNGVPKIADLAELPRAVYDLLARHGRVHQDSVGHEEPAVRASRPARQPLIVRNVQHNSLPHRVRRWLEDTSDGRNARAFPSRVLLGQAWLDRRGHH